jgi:hypothetical protein
MTKVQEDEAPANEHKLLTKFQNSSIRIITKTSMNSQMPLLSIMEFARS